MLPCRDANRAKTMARASVAAGDHSVGGTQESAMEHMENDDDLCGLLETTTRLLLSAAQGRGKKARLQQWHSLRCVGNPAV